MAKFLGNQTIKIDKPVSIISTASVVGPKEGAGPLHRYYDVILDDMMHGCDTWESAESKIVETAFKLAIKKAELTPEDINMVIAGDLLNQSIGSTFGVMSLNRPFWGIFAACANMGAGLSMGAALIDSQAAEKVAVGASSHFCSAEKQFRTPLEHGNQRTPTSSWTVTGSGCATLSNSEEGPFVTHATVGKIIDMGIRDPNNMGAAMAPAAADTIIAHFKDTKRDISYYDLIITGDLGHVGRELASELMSKRGYVLGENYTDCGIKIFDRTKQDTHAGGSGCACSAVTLAGYLYSGLKEKSINKILFVPTGALLSPTSVLQGQSIPGIAHAVAIENSR